MTTTLALDSEHLLVILETSVVWSILTLCFLPTEGFVADRAETTLAADIEWLVAT